MVAALRKTLDALYLTSGLLAALFLLAILLVVAAQVGLNILATIVEAVTGRPTGFLLPAYSELAGYFLVGATFMAAPYALRHGAHIRVSLWIRTLRPGARRAVELWCAALGAALAGYATWFAAALVEQSLRFNDVSYGLITVPLWIPQLPIPIGLAVLTIAFLDDLAVIATGGTPAYRTDEGLLSRPGTDRG